MPPRTATSVALPPEFEDFLARQIASGRFRSAEEIVAFGLELVRDKCRAEAEANQGASQQQAFSRRRGGRLPAILHSALDYAILTTDATGVVTSWNAGAERIFQWSEAEALGRAAAVIFSPEDRAAGAPEDEMRRAREDGAAVDARWHLRRDGSRFWADGELMTLRDEETGAFTGYVKILRDLTSRQQALEERERVDAALRESEARFRHMADSVPALIWMTDPDGEVTFVNMHYEYMFGAPVAELVGTGWRKFVPPEDLARGEAEFRAAFRERRAYQSHLRVRTRDGELRWLRCDGVPRLDDRGSFLGYTGCNVDITEAKLAETALRESEARLRLAMDAGRMAVWESHGATDAVRTSPELNRLLGFSAEEEVTGDQLRSRFAPGERERLRALALEAFARGDRFAQAEVHCKWDDQDVWLLLRGEIKYASGAQPDVFGVALDITERKRAEQHLILLNHELNHRVKNSLAMVQAIAHQSLRGAESVEKARHSFGARLAALARAHDVLTQQSWVGADLREIVAGLVAAHDEDKTRFEISGPPVSLPAKAALSLSMALHELATNAVKYGALSTDEGRVEVAWETTPASPSGGSSSRLRLVWREYGGPPVRAPERQGFGRRLIERGLASEVGGSARIAFEPTGVVCTFEAPLAPGRGDG